jgi:hypothetical protein
MQCVSLGKDVGVEKILLSLGCVCVLPMWALYVVAWFNVDHLE